MMNRSLILWGSITVLGIYIIIALLAPLIAPYTQYEISGRPFEPPGADHLLGTNDIGQDIFSQLVYGAQITMVFGFCAALLSILISTCIGLIIGYYGGTLDEIVCRVLDVIMPIPVFPLLIVLTAFFSPGIIQISILMGFLGSIHGIRVLRAPVLSLSRTHFIEGARAIGATDFHIMMRHLLPNLMPVVVVKFVTSSQRYLVMGVGLSFIGLWDLLNVDWGSMIQNAYSNGGLALGLWWWLLPPGLAVVGLSLALALVGYSLEESFNPRIRVNGR